MSNSLKVKDLIAVGIYSALYMILSTVVATPFAFTVVTYLLYPMVFALISGILTMFFMTKCQKKWGTLIFGTLPFILMWLLGNNISVPIHAAICSLIAELFRRLYGYDQVKGMKPAHIALSMSTVGSFWQVFLFREEYYEITSASMGTAFADDYMKLPLWIMAALYLSVIIVGYFGARIGITILNKHFKKAGVVV